MTNVYTSLDGNVFGNSSRENEQSGITDEDDNAEVVLSVIWQGSRLGAAYYELETEHLYLMPDCEESAPLFTVLKMVLHQIRPNMVVTSCKADERVLRIIEEAGPKTESTEGTSEARHVILLPNIDFALESCRHRLLHLDLSGLPTNMSEAERRACLATLLHLDSVCTVKAAGGLLKFVGQKTLSELATVSAVRTFSLQNVVRIDENSYRVLQIFQDEKHPSVYKSAASASKEGLSLFGICNKCQSSLGKKELRRWFLLPSSDPSLIRERQDAIQFFCQARNMDIVDALRSSLKHIKYLPRIFLRMKTAQASMNDWKTLYQTSYHAAVIGEICRNHAAALPIFGEIAASFSSDLTRVVQLLDKVIDFDEYARQNHFTVKPGVDSEIDKMKHVYNGLPDFMTQVAHQELQDLPPDIQQCSVIYLPQLGYLLTIPATDHMKSTKDYTLYDLRFMFVLNDTVHYKSGRTRDLDALLGDTLCDIYDKETRLMHRLQNAVLETKEVFSAVTDALAQLDSLVALSCASKEYGWVRPEMVNDGVFHVLKARHPLQELCVPCFVANDVCSGGPSSRIKVVTGPNSSGKSTYLKQVALLSFLAHVGCFVPAQRARVPLLDSISTCVEHLESVSLGLSSFLASVHQLSGCLDRSCSDALILVDEFGRHTEGESGAALVASALRHWRAMGRRHAPHVFLATHYLAMPELVPPDDTLSYQTIDVSREDELVILHQLVDGVAKGSDAAETARNAGIAEAIVQRSLQIEDDLKHRRPISRPARNDHLDRYLSLWQAFTRLDVSSTEEIGRFMAYVKQVAHK